MTLKRHYVAGLMTAASLVAFYLALYAVPAGTFTHLTAIPAALVGVTALARVNDIPREEISKRWQVRRMGLIFSGLASVIYILGGAKDNPAPIQWREVLLVWGICLTWLTTPDHPPWWPYITGDKEVPFRSRWVKVTKRLSSFRGKGND